ncbi:LPS export ABC transporter periplasmic protein LptC [Sphingobacterium bovistauri]|uniref:LPS export ABC transporter periplasmic protein LptC n=1 Tax=Sphingobacterium bovistauri TaxID=2781959 RepID=A0ABS7Z186_9SPHI|nr:LPS export ABC transporter periplasmic protein LptC [Sphingobacterium bovistauri]MCA5003930.1 LPS export ABC transporter periplasmic protein LptC [Sphingobacterium bovistauri]
MINSIITKHTVSLFTFSIIGILLFTACENEMKDINAIENIQQEEAVDLYKDVKIIYSDSAIVKAQLTGPEMKIYHDTTQGKNNNYEFEKGLQIIFYDAAGKETQRIKSDYGKQRSQEGITEFRKNVIINMADGSVIKSDEIFYDENQKIYYNTVPITMDFRDARGSMQATSFKSDTDFKNIQGENMTGFYIPSNNNQVPAFGQ